VRDPSTRYPVPALLDVSEGSGQPRWLEWTQRLQAIAQIGLTYARSPYDEERYEQVLEIAEEIAVGHTEADPQVISTLFRQDRSYATPKVDVRGAVFKDDALLMVREVMDHDRWTLPGGWADVGDTPAQAIEREVLEESGFETRAVKLIAVHDRRLHGHLPPEFHTYKLIFRCELVGGRAQTSSETSEVAFFRQDAIPNDLSLARITRSQIERVFEHLRHPDLPTDFD